MNAEVPNDRNPENNSIYTAHLSKHIEITHLKKCKISIYSITFQIITK